MYITSEERSTVFTIEDKYASYSPLLNMFAKTEIPVDRCVIDVPNEGEKEVFVISDWSERYLEQYVNFLTGKDFEMDEGICSFFDYAGHPNEVKYPLDFWKVKLRDNWIRDNMYKLELYKDPYFGLQKIPIVNDIPNLRVKSDTYICAGGVCLYMAGASDTFKDIDCFFVCPKSGAVSFLREVVLNDKIGNCNFNDNFVILPTFCAKDKYGKNRYHQFIFRLYKAPTEVVHGFDVDCCGILFDGKDLYATERALYSLKNKINWFDPKRASPSYAHRLVKYMARGFKIELPLFNPEWIRKSTVQVYFTDWARYFLDSTLLCGPETKGILMPHTWNDPSAISQFRPEAHKGEDWDKHYKFLSFVLNMSNRPHSKGYITALLSEFTVPITSQYFLGVLARNIHRSDRKKYVPSDPVSILVLAKFYGLILTVWTTRSDYDPKERKRAYKRYYKVDDECTADDDLLLDKQLCLGYIDVIQWKEQDPMAQVSSTFYPTPVEDIKDWYRSSPLTKKD